MSSNQDNTNTEMIDRNNLIKFTPLWSLIDTTKILNNALISNISMANIGISMLSDFYQNYRNTLNVLTEKFTIDTQRFNTLVDVAKDFEYNFLNTYKNIIILNTEDLNKLTSAIQTSKTFLNTINEDASLDIDDAIEKVVAAPDHLFQRLSTYDLTAQWAYGVSFNHRGQELWHYDNLGLTYAKPAQNPSRHKLVYDLKNAN